MRNLFDPADRKSILERLGRLEPGAARQSRKYKHIDHHLRQFGA